MPSILPRKRKPSGDQLIRPRLSDAEVCRQVKPELFLRKDVSENITDRLKNTPKYHVSLKPKTSCHGRCRILSQPEYLGINEVDRVEWPVLEAWEQSSDGYVIFKFELLGKYGRGWPLLD